MLAPSNSILLRHRYRRTTHHWFSLCLLLWLFAPQLSASSLILDPYSNQQRLTPDVEYQLSDDKLSLTEVISTAPSKWAASGKSILQWGYTSKQLWVRTSLENHSPAPIERLVVMGQPYLDYVDIYIFHQEELVAHYPLGDLRPLTDRPVVNEQLIVPITVSASGETTIYWSIDAQGAPLMFNVDLWEKTAFEKQHSFDFALGASLISCLFILGLYHLCLSLFLKEKAYAYYACYVFCFVALIGYALGYLQLIILPNSPSFNHFFAHLVVASAIKFSIYLFAIHFLQLRERMPRYHRLIQLILLIEILNTLAYGIFYGLSFREGLGFNRLLNNLTWIIHGPICLVACLYIQRQVKEVRFLIVSWSIMTLVLSIITLAFLGIIPQNKDFYRLLQIAQLSEMLFISFALADHMNQIKIRDIKLEQEKAASAQALIDANEKLYESQLKQIHFEHEVKKAQIENQSKSDFLATMSHEIRTPLNGVLGITELLQTTQLNEIQNRYVNTIQQSGQGLLSVINDILDFSKISSGEMILSEEDIDLTTLVDGCIEILAAHTIDKPIAIAAVIAPDTPLYIRGDEQRLRQILLNVAGNAVKFTSQGTVTIDISLSSNDTDNQTIQFDIKDTGVGMTHDQVTTIFERYKQVGQTSERKAEGTGLGLPISKELVSLMQGHIAVSSVLGQGSHFSIRIPYIAVDIPKHLQLYDKNNLFVDKRILLIDQPGELRSLTVMNLDSWNIQHQVIDSTEQADATLIKAQNSNTHFDAIFINHQNQRKDITHRVRQLSDLENLTTVPPIVVYNFQSKINEQETAELLDTRQIFRVLDCPITLREQKQCLLDCFA